MTKPEININHNDWTQFDRNGYLDRRNIEVRRLDDGSIRIGTGRYAADELLITEDRIEHVGGAWYLTR